MILGNEARGLSGDVRSHVETWVHLPMVGKAESLNVAVAGGVLMYAWLRANLRKQSGSQQGTANAEQYIGKNDQ